GKWGGMGEGGCGGGVVARRRAGIVNGGRPPDTCRSVEVEEASAAITSAVLEDEMPVEQDRLDLREQRIVLVDVPPARLHHPDARVAEVRHQLREKIGGGDEVGVEHGDELAARNLQPGLHSAGLEAAPVGAVVVLDVDALRR